MLRQLARFEPATLRGRTRDSSARRDAPRIAPPASHRRAEWKGRAACCSSATLQPPARGAAFVRCSRRLGLGRRTITDVPAFIDTTIASFGSLEIGAGGGSPQVQAELQASDLFVAGDL